MFSGTWPHTMTPSIDQTLHKFANLLPNWTLLPILNLLPNFGGFHRTLQRVQLANRGRLLLLTPSPVPFGTCICSNVETILSWTCHVYGPFEFRTSFGTSFLSFNYVVMVHRCPYSDAGYCICFNKKQCNIRRWWTVYVQIWKWCFKCKIQKNWCTVTVAPTIEHHGGHSWTPANQRWDQVPGRSQRLLLG